MPVPRLCGRKFFCGWSGLPKASATSASSWTRAPGTGTKLWRKSAKQFLWITFALWTGLTFVGFFVPIRDLAMRLPEFQLGGWESFWLIFYAFATYGKCRVPARTGVQVHVPVCPFSVAMFDDNSLVISYDVARGEPRGGRRRDADYKAMGLGDCIDLYRLCPGLPDRHRHS